MVKRALQLLGAICISLLPLNALRVFLYRVVYRYEIAKKAHIGWGTVIVVSQAHIGRAEIGILNMFRGPFELQIGDGASIGSRNEFLCGTWTLAPEFSQSGYLRFCKIGDNTLITDGHFIDAVGGFEIQAGSWLAGRDSQFWSHGAKVTDRSIFIGQECYLGSAVRMAPGSAVGNYCIVGMGSVVTKKFLDDRLFIAGVPAKIVKENYDWKNQRVFE
ncbi:MAG TPA: hypothetical protein PKH77_16280 [Anaerolineae bacterium]|nr:hypothetical protein [Anaerolineae bacterium]